MSAKPIPLPALDAVEWFDVEVAADIERGAWTRADNPHAITIDGTWRDVPAGMLECFWPIVTGCGKPGRVHPQSYAARLARMQREFDKAVDAYEARRAELENVAAPVSTYGADHSGLRKGKAHAQSYGAEFPLRGFTDAQLTRATKDDKAEWARRPLTYTNRAQVDARNDDIFRALAANDERLQREEIARRQFPAYMARLAERRGAA